MASAVRNRLGSVTRFGRAPPPSKKLRIDKHSGLPRPHVGNLIVRDFAPCRLEEHYHTTLADDLMYLTYKHEHLPRPPPRQIRLTYDSNDPYTKNRYNPPVGGSQAGKKLPPPSSPSNVVQLQRVSVHTFLRDAITNKGSLLPLIAAMRSLAGETLKGGGRHSSQGIQIVRAKKSVGTWKLRPGIPIAVKFDLTGPAMYDFLANVTEFVLPRIRDFRGLQMPAPSASPNSASAVGGVVSFGLPPEALGYFPQIEVNQDSYPKMYGLHIHCITNAEGLGAQNQARALLSGFQLPFLKK
ncbi:ribosomal protein L5 domain-containing protein [Pterulicium gracile]|uniref:Ribosomal protein L5 domain-containing protein n=1 Tax=Pterulicium gracile TaxID=1884261 RepID=A0A5C3QME5_9AGAR|nr:ribosomal protein L5 domain-containing protein [Pterula gracilis]